MQLARGDEGKGGGDDFIAGRDAGGDIMACRPAVPLETPTPCRRPVILAQPRSNSSIFGPMERVGVCNTSTTASMSAGQCRAGTEEWAPWRGGIINGGSQKCESLQRLKKGWDQRCGAARARRARNRIPSDAGSGTFCTATSHICAPCVGVTAQVTL